MVPEPEPEPVVPEPEPEPSPTEEALEESASSEEVEAALEALDTTDKDIKKKVLDIDALLSDLGFD